MSLANLEQQLDRIGLAIITAVRSNPVPAASPARTPPGTHAAQRYRLPAPAAGSRHHVAAHAIAEDDNAERRQRVALILYAHVRMAGAGQARESSYRAVNPLRLDERIVRMSRLRGLGLVTASLVAVLMVLTVAQADAAGRWHISSKWSGKCMDVRDQEADNLISHVQQWSCKDVSNQQWLLVQQSDGAFQAISRRNGNCMSIDGHDTAAGALVATEPCVAGEPAQHWWFQVNPFPNASGSFWLKNFHSDKCVELPGWNTNDGLLLAQSDCVGGWK